MYAIAGVVQCEGVKSRSQSYLTEVAGKTFDMLMILARSHRGINYTCIYFLTEDQRNCFADHKENTIRFKLIH